MHNLLDKYNVPAPRYTSYPTVPFWQKVAPREEKWMLNVARKLANNREISLYLHLPFCENLCTYCGCNKRITKNHKVEEAYIETLLQEWKMYTQLSKEKIKIKELHFGGGTPTFFSPANLERLLTGIFENAEQAPQYTYSFEAHPANTTREHLLSLKKFGFNRVSIGVQDFSTEIMKVINRKQSEEQVSTLVRNARGLNYSINFDLIFGLPLQNIEHIRYNMEKVKSLRPERIAFYSYAHVPWVSPGQRAYSETDLPQGKEKRALYEAGLEKLESIGYHEIGMDHFALPEDELYQAAANKSLHRNFMGYTPFATELLIGLGCSAISDSGDMYVQNEKQVELYQSFIRLNELPIIKGHQLSPSETIIKGHINRLMCLGETDWYEEENRCEELYEGLDRLEELEADGLITSAPFRLQVTREGSAFVRNICMALDVLYHKQPNDILRFSQAV